MKCFQPIIFGLKNRQIVYDTILKYFFSYSENAVEYLRIREDDWGFETRGLNEKLEYSN